jgi:dienelactone hydrolase
VGHGFARGKGNFVEWGKVLASHGYVVAIPGFPGVDHPRNGRLISALLDWLQAASAKSGDRLAGLVDGERRGAVGHSAGGLAVLLAAAKDPSIDVVVALDPVDANNNALTAAGSMKAPLTAIFAQPGACNGNGNARAILSKLAAPHLALSVVGGTHCDAEDPSDFLCALCGGAAAPRQARFKRYAIATLDHVLKCRSGLAGWLGGADMQADTLVTLVASSGFPPACPSASAPQDAGVQDSSASNNDGGSITDGPMTNSRADGVVADGVAVLDTRATDDSSSTDSGDRGESDASSCTVDARASSAVGLWPLLFAIALWLVAGRRKRA